MGLQEYVQDLYVKATVPDPRTQEWLLMQSVWPTVVIVVGYLAVIIGGQNIMKSRQPFQLKTPMMIYNFLLVCVNAYIFYEFVMTTWLNLGFSKVCNPVEQHSDTAHRLARACWAFYFSKSIELTDTVFFMLRKKDGQISFLHLYHHSTMPLIWWIGVKYAPGGESYFSASINSGIHILMYSYYLLSSLGPAWQRFLWWKRYMTLMQLLQFWGIMVHTSYAIYADCGYPNLYNWALIFYDLSHIALFSNFYYQTYTKKARLRRQQKAAAQNGETREQQNGGVNGECAAGDRAEPLRQRKH